MRIKCLPGLVLVAAGLASCTLLPPIRSEPPDFPAPDMASLESRDPFPNWTIPPDDVEPILADRAANDVLISESKGGTTGARRVEIHNSTHDLTLVVKWKSMKASGWLQALPFTPGMLDGINNSPRKEIAAWKIQQLFLDPSDYVVPTSFVMCISVEDASKIDGSTTPTLEGSTCVLGLVSLWMEDVTKPELMLDEERFRRDPVYAHYLANFNLLTYLIKHHDGHNRNFVISRDDSRRQVFSIDNGISFGGVFYNWFVLNWSKIRVPALRKASIDRLRTLTLEDLREELGVVSEGRLGEDGFFDAVEPGPNMDGYQGVRYADGRLQFGLTEDEIEAVWKRIQDLIQAVDAGKIPVF